MICKVNGAAEFLNVKLGDT